MNMNMKNFKKDFLGFFKKLSTSMYYRREGWVGWHWIFEEMYEYLTSKEKREYENRSYWT